MITLGSPLPNGNLLELIDTETPGCTLGPNAFKVENLVKGKRIVIFGLPGAFTPTCSNKHLPGYLEHYNTFKGKGVDEIWCISVNDPYVMGAWARDQKTAGKIRLMADGNATYTKALGLDVDLNQFNMGIRSQRFSIYAENGIVKILNIELPGKFEVSSAEILLRKLP